MSAEVLAWAVIFLGIVVMSVALRGHFAKPYESLKSRKRQPPGKPGSEILISAVTRRGPYIYANFVVDKVKFRFEIDKDMYGFDVIKKCRNYLMDEGYEDIQFVSLEQEVDDRKSIEIDDDAGPKGPYWYMLVRAEKYLFEFLYDADWPYMKAIKDMRRSLWAHGAQLKDVNLLRMQIGPYEKGEVRDQHRHRRSTVKEGKRARSTIEHPVAVTWVVCENARVVNGGTPPDRSSLVVSATAEGVAYNTAQTQITKYLGWHKGGRRHDQLPRRVTLTERGAEVSK